MARKLLILLVFLLLIAGLGLMLYPHWNGQRTDAQIQQNAQQFLQAVENIPTQNADESQQPQILYPELLQAMQDYNKALWENEQADLKDAWSYTQPSFDLKEYGLDSEIFGVISIPSIGLQMPIYLGTTYQHLADGAAHLSQTSIPIGGENTNAVIAGHRGWQGAAYFRDITELKPGDIVIITNLWDELQYRVTETKIIAPYDINQVFIRPGKDMVTLLTCHPYASGGRQRYLVFCERIP